MANHNLTVVGVDAAYTNPYLTDRVVVGPCQTADVLLIENQSTGSYYMVAHLYASIAGIPFNNSTATAILAYQNASPSTPLLPVLPAFNDTPTALTFSSNLTGLVTSLFWSPIPLAVDEDMFITIGLGLSACGSNQTCGAIFRQRMSASMNNHSFVLPTKMNVNNRFNQGLLMTPKLTNVKQVKFNSTVQGAVNFALMISITSKSSLMISTAILDAGSTC